MDPRINKEVTWTDRGEPQTKLAAKIVQFIPKGSPQGFSKSTTDVWVVELLEGHPNGVRHEKGDRIFATKNDIK